MLSPSVPGVPIAPLRLAISNYAHNQNGALSIEQFNIAATHLLLFHHSPA
jgi:hypothetical protein